MASDFGVVLAVFSLLLPLMAIYWEVMAIRSILAAKAKGGNDGDS